MKATDKLVSVIIPTYNEREHIVDLVDSLFAEIRAPLEVIVVDDASPDGTADLVDELQRENVVLIRRKARGLASAFHRGILEARGDIIACVDGQGREIARGLVNYAAHECRQLIGVSSERIIDVLGYVDEPELIHRDNLVLVSD